MANRRVFLRSLLLNALTFVSPGAGGVEEVSREFFVSPSGSAKGDGSIDFPWDLVTALNHPRAVRPGDTIWLRGGVYGDGSGLTEFRSKLTGTSDRPIVLRRYANERAIVNGWLYIQGANTWYWGFEISSTVTDRTGRPDGASKNVNSVDSYGPGVKLINLVLHDTRQGIGIWNEAPDNEAYGNIIYFNGFQASDRGHGHGVYVQNTTGTKLISDNIIFNQFGSGIHGYATERSSVRNVTVQGNIVFSNGGISADGAFTDNIIFAADSGLQNILIQDNYTYYPPTKAAGYSRLGWEWSPANQNVIVRRNYWIGGYTSLMVYRWAKVAFNRNVVMMDRNYLMMFDKLPDQNPKSYDWNDNTYYGTGKWFYSGKETNDIAEWRTISGFDSNSQQVRGQPTGVWKIMRPNKYERGRANIVIYNWDLLDKVGVDLSPFLTEGDRYEIRDVQDFFGSPVASGTYDGKLISLRMSGLECGTPVGVVPTKPQHTCPQFGAFVLLPLGRVS